MTRSALLNLMSSAARTTNATGPTVDAADAKPMSPTLTEDLRPLGALTEEPSGWMVYLNITAGSGTVTVGRLYLEGSEDGGVNFFPLTAESVSSDFDVAPGGVSIRRDILNITALQSVGKVLARYRSFPPKVRAQLVLSGVTPSLTFQLDAAAIW